MQAIILAGGLGTRLRAVVPDLAKPMALIGSRPFLEILLDYLDQQGVMDVILSVGFKHEEIARFFKEKYRSINIRYSIESEPLGTGGAIRKSLEKVSSTPVFVINGDTFLKLNYKNMWAAHQKSGAEMTLALREVEDSRNFGRVVIEKGCITQFLEKSGSGSGLISSGVYLLASDIFEGYSLPETFSIEKEFLELYVHEIRPLPFIVDDYFIDIGIPEEYARAQLELDGKIIQERKKRK